MLLAFALPARAQVPDPAPTPQPALLPGVTYDPAIPTIDRITGHAPGEAISTHAEVERYLHALATASDRMRLVEYGRSWEGRTLWCAVVATPDNLARIDEIRAGMKRLADPRG
ncbi:MAG: zinc carboxypeptidase, partial [Planctomycetes bacterium]|nr:zinc carboxypeptidase [Planctomycetota bacterium]